MLIKLLFAGISSFSNWLVYSTSFIAVINLPKASFDSIKVESLKREEL